MLTNRLKAYLSPVLVLASIGISLVSITGAVASEPNSYSNLKWYTAVLVEKNKYADISIKYPQFIGRREVKELNKYIKEIVLKELRSDRAKVKEWRVKESNKFWDETCGMEYDGGTMGSCSVRLSSSYKVVSVFRDIVSIGLTLNDYTGGGNGNHSEFFGINWDMRSNRLLESKDIFCGDADLKALSSLALTALLDGPFSNIVSDASLVESISAGIEKYTSSSAITLGYRDLFISYQPYEISSGAIGVVSVPIPYSAIKDKLCLRR